MAYLRILSEGQVMNNREANMVRHTIYEQWKVITLHQVDDHIKALIPTIAQDLRLLMLPDQTISPAAFSQPGQMAGSTASPQQIFADIQWPQRETAGQEQARAAAAVTTMAVARCLEGSTIEQDNFVSQPGQQQ